MKEINFGCTKKAYEKRPIFLRFPGDTGKKGLAQYIEPNYSNVIEGVFKTRYSEKIASEKTQQLCETLVHIFDSVRIKYGIYRIEEQKVLRLDTDMEEWKIYGKKDNFIICEKQLSDLLKSEILKNQLIRDIVEASKNAIENLEYYDDKTFINYDKGIVNSNPSAFELTLDRILLFTLESYFEPTVAKEKLEEVCHMVLGETFSSCFSAFSENFDFIIGRQKVISLKRHNTLGKALVNSVKGEIKTPESILNEFTEQLKRARVFIEDLAKSPDGKYVYLYHGQLQRYYRIGNRRRIVATDETKQLVINEIKKYLKITDGYCPFVKEKIIGCSTHPEYFGPKKFTILGEEFFVENNRVYDKYKIFYLDLGDFVPDYE